MNNLQIEAIIETLTFLRGKLCNGIYGKDATPALTDAVCSLRELQDIKTKKALNYAEWVDKYDGKYNNPCYICSACQKSALYTFETDELGHEVEKQELSEFCPRCGKPMIKRSEEN